MSCFVKGWLSVFTEWFWKNVTISVVKKTNIYMPHRAPSDDDAARPIPVEKRWPGLAGTPLVLADEVPKSERLSAPEMLVLQGVLGLKNVLSLSQAYPESYRGQGAPYYPEYVALHPASLTPPDFAPGQDHIAGVAQRGPFSLITRQVADGYELDIRHVEALTPKAGYLKTGGLAHLSRQGDSLKTDWVELDGQRHTPGTPGWELIEKRFLTGLNTHTTVIEHLINCHMCVGESHVLAAVEALPARHALRAIIQPFAIETLRVNGDNIDGLIKSEHSNVPSYSGYPLGTLDAVLRQVAQGFDVRRMDPEWRSSQQGTLGAGFPTVEAEVELFRLFKQMWRRYLHEVVQQVDAPTRAWVQLVDQYIPNGVKTLAGIEDWEGLTLDQVAHVAAVVTFTSSVIHHIVADMVRDYMMSFHVMPSAVKVDGYPTRGTVIEKMNSITIAGILRYRLVDDTVVLPDGPARAIWSEFQTALKGIQARIDQGPADQRLYQIHPVKVPSSIHA